uniref:MIF4G domain-containing protein n=1 Tax=Meloidogyne hapla TaxID=6305 RepID=A0A1I8BFE0_MELHA
MIKDCATEHNDAMARITGSNIKDLFYAAITDSCLPNFPPGNVIDIWTFSYDNGTTGPFSLESDSSELLNWCNMQCTNGRLVRNFSLPIQILPPTTKTTSLTKTKIPTTQLTTSMAPIPKTPNSTLTAKVDKTEAISQGKRLIEVKQQLKEAKEEYKKMRDEDKKERTKMTDKHNEDMRKSNERIRILEGKVAVSEGKIEKLELDVDVLMKWKAIVEDELEEARAQSTAGKGCQADKFSEGPAATGGQKPGGKRPGAKKGVTKAPERSAGQKFVDDPLRFLKGKLIAGLKKGINSVLNSLNSFCITQTGGVGIPICAILYDVTKELALDALDELCDAADDLLNKLMESDFLKNITNELTGWVTNILPF